MVENVPTRVAAVALRPADEPDLAAADVPALRVDIPAVELGSRLHPWPSAPLDCDDAGEKRRHEGKAH